MSRPARSVAVLALAALCGCTGAKTCDAACDGCCDVNAVCQAVSNDRCGRSGSSCIACALGQSCLAGGCTSNGGGGGSGGGSATGGGSGGGSGGGGGSNIDVTCDANPVAETSQTVFTKVGQANCANCHAPPSGQGIAYGDYSTPDKMYSAMVSKASIYKNAADPNLMLVAPNDLANSTAWLKLNCPSGVCFTLHGSSVGAPMPYQTTALSASDAKVFKDWICTGATH